MSEPYEITKLARFFMLEEACNSIALKNVGIEIKSGVLSEISDPNDYRWHLEDLRLSG